MPGGAGEAAHVHPSFPVIDVLRSAPAEADFALPTTDIFSSLQPPSSRDSLFPDALIHGRHRPRASLEDITAIRNAAKLGAKFFKERSEQIGDRVMSLCSISYDVGLILALAGERRDMIVAGILHNAFSIPLQKEIGSVQRTVARKFGPQVKELIDTLTDSATIEQGNEWWRRYSTPGNLLEGVSRDTATLHCAVATAIIEARNRVFADGGTVERWLADAAPASLPLFERQLAAYQHLGVSLPVMEQYRQACAQYCRSSLGSPPEALEIPVVENGALYEGSASSSELNGLLRDVHDIRSAALLSSDLFEKVPRKWGPTEVLPLSAHQYEVAMLLTLAGASRDLIIAGSLHDVFEGYIRHDVELLAEHIGDLYGGAVLSLIRGVTEPPKDASPGNWWERKLAVLWQVQAGTTDLATLVCATKISTLAAGNKMLYMGRPVSDWSSGSLEDNVRVFNTYLHEFERKGVPEILLEQFRAELEIFRRGTIQRRASES